MKVYSSIHIWNENNNFNGARIALEQLNEPSQKTLDEPKNQMVSKNIEKERANNHEKMTDDIQEVRGKSGFKSPRIETCETS